MLLDGRFHASRQQRGAAARQAQAVLDRKHVLRQGRTAAAFHEHAPERQRLIEVCADVVLPGARGQLLGISSAPQVQTVHVPRCQPRHQPFEDFADLEQLDHLLRAQLLSP